MYMGCNETAEEVDTKVTFNLPEFDIDPRNPPVTDEKTVKPSNAFKPTMRTFDYLPNVTHTDQIDVTFQAAIYGKDGIPLESLGKSTDNEKVEHRLRQVNNIIRAQLYSNYTRRAVNSSTEQPALQATIMNPSRLRLVQDSVSTHVLVILLLVLVVLAVAVTMLLNPRNIIPKNLCSIAATASLLADSDFLGDLPENAEIEKHARFEKPRFWLGWEDPDVNEAHVKGANIAIRRLDDEYKEDMGQDNSHTELMNDRGENQG